MGAERARSAALIAWLSIACASALSAQAALTSKSSDDWKMWGSISLGPGNADGRARLAGNAALWLTRDRLAIWVREASASRVLDPGDVGDVSVLVGIHPHVTPHVDFVAGVGAGMSLGHDNTGAVTRRESVLATGAQLNLNYRVVGLAIDGFAGFGNSSSYYGVGLGLAFGWFR
jgi:hypothetical protein